MRLWQLLLVTLIGLITVITIAIASLITGCCREAAIIGVVSLFAGALIGRWFPIPIIDDDRVDTHAGTASENSSEDFFGQRSVSDKRKYQGQTDDEPSEQ